MSDPRPRRASAKKAPRGRGEATGAQAVAEIFRAVGGPPERSAVPATLLKKRRERARRRIVEALEAAGATGLTEEVAAEVEALAREWAEHAFEDGFEKAAAFEQRCFEEAEIAQARGSTELRIALETKHRAAVVRDFGKIEIRGLQMSARVYQDLDAAYVPLWVQDGAQEPEVLQAGEGIEIHRIPRLTVPELLAKHARALLVGAPGSGKTTIVAYLAAQAASGQLHALAGWEASPVPFVVAVRSLAGSRLDAETIAAAAGTEPGFVRRVLEQGRALVLVDGLDEAREGAAKLVPAVQALAKAHPGNRILVTSRPAATAGSPAAAIAGFASAQLSPMSREEVYSFIDRWCAAAEQSMQKDRRKAQEDARRAAEDLKARVQTSRPVERLAQTPLICSVLCLVHRFLGQRIPERRAALYETCTNVLLYEWDRAKFADGAAIGQLDAQEKKLLLGGLARWMHDERIAEAAREEVVRQFAERLPWIKREAREAESIVREIQDRSGILVERRPGFYAFSHLTFQEYLTAVETVRAGHLYTLVEVHDDRWWHEVTVLSAGLPGADAAGLIQRLLKAESGRGGLSAAGMLAAQCAETAIELPASLRGEVEKRIAALVPPRSDDDVDEIVRLGEVAGPVLLRSLDHPDPARRARAALALGQLGYEPACGALLRMLGDTESTEEGILLRIMFDFSLDSSNPRVSDCSAVALFAMAVGSSLVRSSLERAIPGADPHAFGYLLFVHSHLRLSETPAERVKTEARAYLERLAGLIGVAHPRLTFSRLAARSG